MLRQLIQKLQDTANEARALRDMPPEGAAVVGHMVDMELNLVPLYEELFRQSSKLACHAKRVIREYLGPGALREASIQALTALQKEAEWVVSLDGTVLIETTRCRTLISEDERLLRQAVERARMEVQHLQEEHIALQRNFDMQRRRMEELRGNSFLWAIMELKSLLESGKAMHQLLDETQCRMRITEERVRWVTDIWQRIKILPELGKKIEEAVQSLANGASFLKGHLDEVLHILHATEEAKVEVVIEAYAQTLAGDVKDVEAFVT